MRWRPLIYLALSLAAVAGVLAAAPTPPAANPNEPIDTRQNVFSIPFDRPKAAREVELLVSADLGASWQLSTKAKPEQGSFVFRAPHDGEYWFSLRTLDKQGKARPDGPPLPELKVVVDTVPPRLDLLAQRPGGEVAIQWQIVDPNLKPDSLKIDVQSGPGEPWEGVGIVTTAAASRSRHTLVGQTTCWPKPGKGPLTVRAQVSDRAGNLASSQVQPKVDGGPPGDRDKGGNPKLVDPRVGDVNGSRTGVPPPSAPRGSAQTGTAPANSYDRDTQAARQWLADASTNDPLGGRQRQAASANPRTSGGGDGDWRAAPPLDTSTRTSTPAINASTLSASTLSDTAASRNGANVNSASSDSASRGPGAHRTLDLNLLPPGEHPRMVNSRSFDLEYEVDSVGTSGVAKVELWGTHDGGRTWSSFGLDSDNRSPVRVHVDGEGIYGFRIVVQSGSGLGGLAPRSGDLPEIWVGVDLTRPVARITSAAIQPDTGELLVRWEASDELPDQRPIALSFSDHPNGPWSPIASGLENTGSFAWRLDNRAPDKIYLRLEARDEAGNVGVFVTTEPVLLDRQRPQGRIRGIRPVGEAATPNPDRR